MATRITPEQKKQINELYLKLKTYAAVGREMGISASTVKKYVLPDYVPVSEIKHIPIDGEGMRLRLETFVLSKEQFDDPYLLTLTEEEEAQIKNELWKELSI